MPARKTAKKGKTAKMAKKATAAAPIKKIAAVKKAFSKGETVNYLAQRASLKRGDVVQVMNALSEIIEAHVKKQGPGIFALAGLAKFKVVRKPATKARRGINPFTGEETTFKAKPARNVIKIRPLKRLKDMV